MEISCDIAMDLVELYTSDTAGPDSTSAVKSHLRHCSECRRYYEGYRKSLKKERDIFASDIPDIDPSEKELSENVKKLSKRIRKRRILSRVTNSTLLGFGSITLILGIIILIHSKRKGRR